MIRFTRETLLDLRDSMSREWLETNGLGGFSSSTIIGLNTRRYHGLLSAATRPPVGRMLLLSKLEETLIIDDQRYELSANQYPGAIYPHGFQYQTDFRLDPFPVFVYEINGAKIQKSIFMVQSENTVVVQYDLINAKPADRPTRSKERKAPTAPADGRVSLEIRPLIAFRDYHNTTHENSALDSQ